MKKESFCRWAIQCRYFHRGNICDGSPQFMGKYGLLIGGCDYEDLRLSLPICHFATRKEARVVASQCRRWPLNERGWGMSATPVKVRVTVEEI